MKTGQIIRHIVRITLLSMSILGGGLARAESWARTYGGGEFDLGFSMQETWDGGWIVAGATASSGEGENDVWVVKLDGDGEIVWQKTYGGSGNDYATCIGLTMDGGYIVVGTTYSFGAGGSDAWLLKLDGNGETIWQKAYGGGSYDYATAIEVFWWGYVVAGNTFSFGDGDSNIWVMALVTDGRVAWERTYGGGGFDSAFSIRQTDDWGYLIAGETFSFGQGENDLWLLKLDFMGDAVWQKTYGASGFDWPFRLQLTEDGGSIVAGNTLSSGAGEDDVWVLKLDDQGRISWQKTYGGTRFDWPASIQPTSDDGYIVVGGTYSFGMGQDDLWVIKLKEDGDVDWQKTYGGSGSDYGTVIKRAPGGGYKVIGVTSSFGAGKEDLWVLKLDSNGEIPDSNNILPSAASVSDTSVTPMDTDCIVESTFATVTDTGPRPGDFDSDGVVNLRDFAMLASAWLVELDEPGWDPKYDISISADGYIDVFDLAVVVEDWLAGVE